jgi:hypothetical protein
MKLNKNEVLENEFFYFASAEVHYLSGRENYFFQKERNK